jgi:hypothetical protein
MGHKASTNLPFTWTINSVQGQILSSVLCTSYIVFEGKCFMTWKSVAYQNKAIVSLNLKVKFRLHLSTTEFIVHVKGRFVDALCHYYISFNTYQNPFHSSTYFRANVTSLVNIQII